MTVAGRSVDLTPTEFELLDAVRGRRADRGGSGLGLTIARDLVAAHGGTIRADRDGIPGHGTVMRVRRPIRD